MLLLTSAKMFLVRAHFHFVVADDDAAAGHQISAIGKKCNRSLRDIGLRIREK